MDTTIPALSLRQPWAWAVLHAGKMIENRTWATQYRGRIRLHAAQTWDEAGYEWLKSEGDCDTFLPAPFDPVWFPLGAYIGEVTVVDCFTLLGAYAVEERQKWAFGPWCWILKNPVAYPVPIPGRGYPGLYWPERVAEKLAQGRERDRG